MDPAHLKQVRERSILEAVRNGKKAEFICSRFNLTPGQLGYLKAKENNKEAIYEK